MRKLFGASFNSSLRIGVARRRITVLRVAGGWRATSSALLADIPVERDIAHKPEPAMSELQATLAQNKCAGSGATVIVADELVRYFMVTPPQNAGSLRDCQAAADMRFRALFGEAATAWTIQADWNMRQPFLACAMPAALLAALDRCAASQRLALLEIAPQFVAAWNRWRGALVPGAWFGMLQDGVLMLGATDRKRLCGVRAVPYPPEADAGNGIGWLPELLAREALRLDLPAPGRIQLLGSPAGAPASQSAGTLACDWLDHGAGAQAPGAETVQFVQCALAATGMRA